ncbi:MAG: hypothetical protein J2P25_18805 [Nocardiopsaceae bacterium]|nr:hypothetical protein [Nocardiopsaceae bacterium]
MADDKFDGFGDHDVEDLADGDDGFVFYVDDIEDLDNSGVGIDDLDETLDFADVAEAVGLPDELPALRLPAAAELAASARAAELPATLARLADWVGDDGRPVTDEGDLEPDDAAAATRALAVHPDELAFLWEYALTSDWVAFDDDDLDAEGLDEEDGELDEDDEEEDFDGDALAFGVEHVSRGETAGRWASAADDDVLEAWRSTFVSVLSGTFDVIGDTAVDDAIPEGVAEMELDGQGIAMAIMLFLARGEGLALTDISEVMLETATAEMEPHEAAAAKQALTDCYGDPAMLVTSMLARLGAIHPPTAADGAVRLTPLGLWAVREELTGIGLEIPLLPASVEEMTAQQLLLMADDADQEEFEAEADVWVAGREPGEAARELLRVAADEGPDSRLLAVSVVTRIGGAAEPAWRESLGTPELRPYAKIALAGLGEDPDAPVPAELEPQPDDLAWVATDMLVLACDDEEPDPESVAACLGDSVPAGEEASLFEMISRASHPDAVEVLTHIGLHHPDKRIAKDARTAAHRARSRRSGSLS